jgi:uncharacterized membrane protein
MTAFLPDWAPSLHPMIVHFPIALLLLALLFDVLYFIFRKQAWLHAAANSLYVLGGIAAVAAFFSGRQAADLAEIPAFANSALAEHADLGQYTAWFFGLYALLRLAGWWLNWQEKVGVLLLLLVVAAGGAVLLYETAEHGAELVYRHGIGVQAADEARKAAAEKAAVEAALSEGGIVQSPDGSWKWRPAHGAEIVLQQQFRWLAGDPAALRPGTAHDPAEEDVLMLHPQNSRALLVAGTPLEGVQMDVRVNLDDFRGTLMLVHHVQDAQNFDFVALGDGQMRLGRMINGKMTVEDEDTAEVSGWAEIRAVGHKGHFRGYVNGKLVTHGHAKDLPPGAAGLLIDGSGTLRLAKIAVQAVR